MNQKKFMIVAGAAVVLLGAGVWLSMHRSNQQADRGGGSVFAGSQERAGRSRGDSPLQGRREPHYPAPQCRRLDRGGAPVPGGCRARARARAGTRRTARSSNRKPAIRLTTQSSESRRPTSRPPDEHAGRSGGRHEDLVVDRRQGRRRPRRLRAQARRGGERAGAAVHHRRSRPEALDRSAHHRHPRRQRARHRGEARERPGLSC